MAIKQSTQQAQQWQPYCDLTAINFRATLLKGIRQFFEAESIMEVDTSLLSKYPLTDINIHNITTSLNLPDQQQNPQQFFLQTSPEYQMKRLLAAGSGSIYQITKAFRDQELGTKHNPEFTLLEWYWVEHDYHALMRQLAKLINIFTYAQCEYYTYREVFDHYLNINPHTIADSTLVDIATDKCNYYQPNNCHSNKLTRNDCLELIFTDLIQPKLNPDKLCFIYEFPVSQAALAQITTSTEADNNNSIAQRFELYYRSLELANGYQELLDAEELEGRFLTDIKQQPKINKQDYDPLLLAAMANGLPMCSGVALGIERLMMAILYKTHINQVMGFPVSRV